MSPKSNVKSEPPRAATRADLFERKEPRSATVPVALEEAASAAYERAADAHEAAVHELDTANNPNEKEAAQERVDAALTALREAEAAVQAVSVNIVFRTIGAKRYEELVDAHPPTDDQIAIAKKQGWPKPVFNGETFPIALIAASMSEPELSSEDVTALWEQWNRAERMELFAAALDVNTRARRVAELGKGSG